MATKKIETVSEVLGMFSSAIKEEIGEKSLAFVAATLLLTDVTKFRDIVGGSVYSNETKEALLEIKGQMPKALSMNGTESFGGGVSYAKETEKVVGTIGRHQGDGEGGMQVKRKIPIAPIVGRGNDGE